MKNYIQELAVVPGIAKPVVIFYDNNGAITQAKESTSHHRSEHILRRYHLLREMVVDKVVKPIELTHGKSSYGSLGGLIGMTGTSWL
ncbi:hypothetical protein Sango_1582600 [Sesamum angolense]|uniref:Uncharacterized protein n=1 Tax=Sesamum angolense TaxID=2727404 RepID=A0AAE2BTX6_9LAMI|nr:hypothetical protein Sango_1582600 [Sesamum angolense]